MIATTGLGGRFLRRRLLGAGSFAQVWLVEDRLRPGYLLALKELAPIGDPARDMRHADALRREFATLATLRHPAVVEVHEFDAGEESQAPRFTLELVEGRDFVEAVRTEGPAAVVELAAEGLRALGFLHALGLVHRDVKPANLLVRHRPRLGRKLVLVDFGFVRGPADGDDDRPQAAGTLPYLAPEVLAGGKASARSDLYALGVVVHEAVFGSPPFVPRDGAITDFLEEVHRGAAIAKPLPAGFPEGLAAWIARMISPDPESRPSRASEALALLDGACGTQHPEDTPVDRAARLASGFPAEREREIGEVRDALDPSKGPRVVFLAGAPGSGKTRLLRWLEADAIRRGWRVIPHHPAALADVDRLRAAAASGPTLLVVDEADSADLRAAEALDRIAREAGRSPVQAAVGIRPAAVKHVILQRLLRDAGVVPTVRRVDLASLDANGLRSLAARAVGGGISDERLRRLLEASGGSAAVAESLLVEAARDLGEPIPSVPRFAVPAARLALLSTEATRWIEGLAVLREAADEARLASLAGVSAEAARAAGEEAYAAGLVHRSGLGWRAESGELLDRVLAGIDPRRRRDLHRRAAEMLARSSAPSDPWILHRLHLGAGDAERAAALAVEAADAALAGGDPDEAARRFGRALRLLPRSPSRRFDLRLRQGEAFASAGLHAEAGRAFGAASLFAPDAATRRGARVRQAHALAQAGRFRRALAVARSVAEQAALASDRGVEALARHAEGIALARTGRESEALHVLEAARAELRTLEDPLASAEILLALAACKVRLGRPDAEPDLREALALLDRAPTGLKPRHDGDAIKARIALAVLAMRGDDLEGAREAFEAVRIEAAEAGQLALEEVAISRLSAIAIDQGRLDDAMALAREAADLALHLGDPNLALVNAARLADARIRCGRPGEAAAALREALDLPLDRAEPENVDYARMLLADAWVEAEASDEEAPRAVLQATLARCRERRKTRPWLMALVIELERRSRAGSAEPTAPVESEFDAVAAAAEAEPDAEIRFRAALAKSAARLARGDPEAARRLAEEARTLAGERAYLAFQARAGGLLGRALEAAGRDDEARRVLEESRALLDRAAERIRDESVRRDFLGRAAYASLRLDSAARAGAGGDRLGALYDMIRVLNSETDPDALLDSIIDLVLRAVDAERGLVLLREDREGPGAGEFALRASRGLERETEEDATSYSRSIVAAAGQGRSILALDAGSDARFRDLASVSLYGIRSLMCVPLRSRGRILGTVYLDSRREGRLFTPDDLRFVEAFADHAGIAVENARMRSRLEWQNRQLQAAAEARTQYASLVGRSSPMQAVFSLIEKVAGTDLPVLIRGESGTGKELVARAIHFQGPRRRRPFLSENCAALPETLLESELFGHVRGAFTGADRSRPGLFVQADGGTLFLDEVGDMSPAMQARLLRVLEDGQIRPVGGERPVPVDVRVVSATHRDLHGEIRNGRFRQDLLYRLQVLTIELPPLRERPGDVALLAAHFLDRIGRERGRPPAPVDDDALALLERHSWPGNVRELQNALQRLALLAGNRAITTAVIGSDPVLRQTLLPEERARRATFSIRAGEKEQIQRALAAAHGNRVQAARLLGVSRATLYRKLERHGL